MYRHTAVVHPALETCGHETHIYLRIACTLWSLPTVCFEGNNATYSGSITVKQYIARTYVRTAPMQYSHLSKAGRSGRCTDNWSD